MRNSKSLKDALDVLIVPVPRAFWHLVWPAFAARRSDGRTSCTSSVRELEEAAPEEAQNLPPDAAPSHSPPSAQALPTANRLSCNPVENAELVLSLNPKLSYSLSQMRIACGRGI